MSSTAAGGATEMATRKRFTLARRPAGTPVSADFRLVEEDAGLKPLPERGKPAKRQKQKY